jgi:hypothetical protein
MMFAKIKALVRSAAPRCFDSLAQTIGAALEAVTPGECAAYLRHAAYHST